MGQIDKKFQKAKKKLDELLKGEIPPGRINRLIENGEVSKLEIYETLEKYGYEWTGGKWDLSRPQWLKNAIKQFENDLQGHGHHELLIWWPQYEKDDRMELFHDYLRNMEPLTESAVKKLSEYEEPTINEESTTAYDQHELQEWLAYEHYSWVRQVQLAADFVYVLRNSFFVNLCSFLEAYLVDRCPKSSKVEPPAVKNALRILVGSLALVEKVPEWKEILRFINIRNCIVHNDGHLDESRGVHEEIKKFAVTKANLVISEGRVILEKGFCEEATETVSRFLRKIDMILIDVQ